MEQFDVKNPYMGIFEVPEEIEPSLEDAEAESLEPQLMEIPGLGEVLVGGNPYEIAEKLDDHQGDNIYNFQGDCGLVTLNNLLVMAGRESTEDEVITRALTSGLCRYSDDGDPSNDGGTNVFERQELAESYDLPCEVFASVSDEGSLEAVADYVEAGHGVNMSVNAGYLWQYPDAVMDGSSNHSIVVTGTVRDVKTGELKGLIVCDSGLTDEPSSAKYISKEILKDAYVEAGGTSVMVTREPIR